MNKNNTARANGTTTGAGNGNRKNGSRSDLRDSSTSVASASANPNSNANVRPTTHYRYWHDKYTKFKQFTSEKEWDEALDVIESTPHINTELSEIILEFKNLVQKDKSQGDNLSSETEGMDLGGPPEVARQMNFEGVPDNAPPEVARQMDEMQKIIRQLMQQRDEKDKKIAAIKQEIAEKKLAGKIEGYFNDVEKKAKEVEDILSALASFSQANGATVGTQTQIQLEQAEEEYKRHMKQLEPILGGRPLPEYPTREETAMKNLFRPNKSFTKFSPESLAKVQSDRLQKLNDKFQALFQSATFLPHKHSKEELPHIKPDDYNQYYKDRIQETVQNTNEYFNAKASDPDKDTVQGLHLPGPTSHEVDGVQPIVAVLIQAIANCCHLDYMDEMKEENGIDADGPKEKCRSPPKSGLQKEVISAEITMADQYRKCDMAVWKRGKCVVMMLDEIMRLTVEVKPGQRRGYDVLEIAEEARRQCLSRLSRYLLGYLHFGEGAGVEAEVCGLHVSCSHVEVIKLRLVDPGKKTSAVEMETSGFLPLLTKGNFRKWYGVDALYPDQVNQLQKEMYGEGNQDRNFIPLGIVALYELVKSEREDLVGPQLSEVATGLGDLIGSGSFGMVFKRRDEEIVTKVTKNSIRYWIDREFEILQVLKEGGELPSSLPRVLERDDVKVSIGGVGFKLASFSMTPVCREMYSLPDLSHDLISKIVKDIMGALEYIHSKGIAHNDVNDRNVLVRMDHGKYEGVLIDFSSASPLLGKVQGFSGTPDYAHQDIHKMSALWVPVPNYDYASLGLTAVVFLNQGLIPWESFHGIQRDDSVFEGRIEKAHESLEASCHHDELRGVVNGLLDHCKEQI